MGQGKVPLGKDTSDLYRAPRADYEGPKGADLPGVEPPSGASLAAIPPVSGPVDPETLHILKLVQGGKFKEPFIVTLQRKVGIRAFKTDAGTKQEDSYEICYETVREPSDLLRLAAGVAAGSYKHLNNNTLEFQLMLYLAFSGGLLEVPGMKPASAAESK